LFRFFFSQYRIYTKFPIRHTSMPRPAITQSPDSNPSNQKNTKTQNRKNLIITYIRFNKPKQQQSSCWKSNQKKKKKPIRRPSNLNNKNSPTQPLARNHQTKTTKTQNQIQNPAGPPIPASSKHQMIRERDQHKRERESTCGRQRSAVGERESAGSPPSLRVG
jgi:hypothetical protein